MPHKLYSFFPSPKSIDMLSPTDLDNPVLSRKAFVMATSFSVSGNFPCKSGYFAKSINVLSMERTVNLKSP